MHLEAYFASLAEVEAAAFDGDDVPDVSLPESTSDFVVQERQRFFERVQRQQLGLPADAAVADQVQVVALELQVVDVDHFYLVSVDVFRLAFFWRQLEGFL